MAGNETQRRVGATAGVVGPILFVSVFTVEGWLRPGYEPSRMFVSALSLGSRGWIQITSFLVVGSCFLLFSRALALQFPEGKASRFGPLLVALIGLGLFFSGPFVMDLPMNIPFPRMTLLGKIHSLLGALVFSSGPVSAFAFFRRFRSDASWQVMAWWTLTAGIVMAMTVVLLKFATLPPPAPPNALAPWAGAIQRALIVALMSWVASLAFSILRRLPRQEWQARGSASGS